MVSESELIWMMTSSLPQMRFDVSATIRRNLRPSRKRRLRAEKPVLFRAITAPEEKDRCREAVNEMAARDGAELARREEACHWNVTERALHRTDVVIRLAEEPLTAPIARKEKRTGYRLGALRFEHRAEILAGRLGIADLELDGLPHLGHVADRDRARIPIDADEVADHEVAATELGLELGRRLANMEAAPHQELIALGRRRVELLHALERGLPAELEDYVALRSRDRERLADGPAPLRDDRSRPVRSFEDRPDGALREDLIVRDETRAARDDPARCHAAHDRQTGSVLVQMVEKKMRRKRVWIRQHD